MTPAIDPDTKRAHHLLVLLFLAVHYRAHKLADGLDDESAEGTGKRGVATFRLWHSGPCLGLRVEEVVAPQIFQHLVLSYAQLRSVDVREALQGEPPATTAAPKGDGAPLRRQLGVAQQGICVCRGDDIHGLDGQAQAAVYLLRSHLRLQDATIELVEEQARLHPLRQRLTQDCLRPHGAALDAVHDNDRAIGDPERGGDLPGLTETARAIDEVDQVGLRICAILVVLEVQRRADRTAHPSCTV
mmetsp:Transcript_8322/g.23902  ORF Transcript_8322/g.23902 Transcript_8322/m.23902 type:complete len:244 (-) Transcript_8322:252-983(-)